MPAGQEHKKVTQQYSFDLKPTAVRGLNQAFFLLASCAIAAAAHASYGQMRLDGAGLFLAFVLTVGYAPIVDVALLAGLFRVPDWGGYPQRVERACRGPE